MAECDHKFKIFKEFAQRSKNMIGIESEETVYHLQCSKCGDMKTRVLSGNSNK